MSRRKKLGNLGEQWTNGLLRRAGFRAIQDLNIVRYNHPGGDFLAERGGKRFFITVKARNKYVQGSHKLNGGYNIYPDKVQKAAEEYDAIPAWLTVQFDTNRRCFSAYFGTIESLRNPNAVAVPMTPNATAGYECLAKDRHEPAISPDLSNQLRQGNSVSRGKTSKSRNTGNTQHNYQSEFDRIAVEQLGFRAGTKTQHAVALYLRPNGATTVEVTAANGGPYLNCLKQVEAMGHKVIKKKVPDSRGRMVTSYKIALNNHPELTKAEITRLVTFLRKVIKEGRDLPSRPDLKGLASGSALNLLKQYDNELAKQIGSRQKLVSVAESLGFIVRPYRGGLGLKGSGVWETLDLPS